MKYFFVVNVKNKGKIENVKNLSNYRNNPDYLCTSVINYNADKEEGLQEAYLEAKENISKRKINK